MEASHWKLYVENPCDIPIGDHAFASSYVIRTLNQITKIATDLDTDLRRMQEEHERKIAPKRKSAKHLRTLGGVVGILLGGYLVYKLSTKTNLAKLTEYLQPFLDNQPHHCT
uniref:Uncharacterized protein n=1 Tax=Lutzomyia longipalpis TaxID=7200 RepID=A0A1B0CQI7_LUTLO